MKTWFVLSFLILSACNKDNFPKYAQLGDLRILTIKALADQGEVNPGTTVTLQPVVSDLNGGGRTLMANVQSCIDPGIGLGASVHCAQPDTNTTTTFSSTTLGSGNIYTGEAPTFSVTVPPSPLILDFLPPYLQYNGVAYLVIYTLSSPDGYSVTSFKRILVSSPSKTVKNLNPAIASVTAGSTVLSASNVYSANEVNLTPTYTVGGETYSSMAEDGTISPQTEQLNATWFFTDGTMTYQRTSNTDSNQWTPAKPSNRSAAIVFTAHDGRGGEDYKIFIFN